MKKKYKLILGGAVAVIIAFVVILQMTKTLEVKAVQIEPQAIAKTFKEEGLVIAGKDTPVYTTVTGKIVKMPVQEGQAVQEGDLLLALDTLSLVYQLEQLEGQLRSLQAEQQIEIASLGLDKLEKLYQAGAISRKEYEDAKLKAESQIYPGQIAALHAQIKSVQYQIEQSNIKAPQGGIVSQLALEEGMVVASGTFVMNIFSPESYQVETYVLTEDVARLAKGHEADLIQENKSGDILFKGSIESIAPSAVEKTSALGLREQRVKVIIKPQIPENLQLKPGFALDVSFTIERQEGQLVVPKTAVFPYQEGEAVWIIDGGKARIRAIKRGFENDKDVAVSEGLRPGDTIILNPQLAGLKDGARVKKVSSE